MAKRIFNTNSRSKKRDGNQDFGFAEDRGRAGLERFPLRPEESRELRVPITLRQAHTRLHRIGELSLALAS